MDKMFSVVFVLVILTQCVYYGDAFCFMNAPKMDDSGNPLPCTYEGVTVGFGESYEDYDKCVQYSCSDDGSLSVCGIGHNAGVVAIPDGCTRIDGEKCSMKIVQSNDHSTDCFSHIFG